VSGPGVDDYVGWFDAARAGAAPSHPPPPPWMGWLVAALVVQRERQRWHRDVVSSRLDHGGDDHGPVPGMPGWTFEQHGMGYCLLGPDGELVDVDLRDREAAIIDPWFFANRVKSIAHARLAEGRLWRWRPKTDLVVDGLDALAAARVIYRQPDSHLFTLAAPLAVRAAEVARDLAADDAEVRWRRALGDRDDVLQRGEHRVWLVGLVRSSRKGPILEVALDAVEPEVGYELLRAQLGGPLDHAAGRAIELMRARPAMPACPDVVSVVQRVAPSDDPPYPGYQAVAYLLERGMEPALAREKFDELAAVKVAKGFRGNPFESSFAILALRFLPDRAMPLVRRALRSTTPICVQEIAALLAVLDQPWCHRELAAALAEERTPTHPYLVAALRRSSGDLARRRAAAYDVPPARDPEATGFTYDEVAYANADSFMDRAVAGAASVASELRGKYADDWTG
jgi:hypothetical protein